MIKKMKGIKKEVHDLLMQFPPFRDDDRRLVAGFYYRRFGGREVLGSMSAMDFLKVFASKSQPSPDDITRVRRKLQEQFPELRGEKYNERHHLESEVRQDIHQL